MQEHTKQAFDLAGTESRSIRSSKAMNTCYQYEIVTVTRYTKRRIAMPSVFPSVAGKSSKNHPENHQKSSQKSRCFLPLCLAFCVTAFWRTELSRPGRSPGGANVFHNMFHRKTNDRFKERKILIYWCIIFNSNI